MSNFNPDTSRSIFVVGDDAQSIYGFRGSKIELILNFEKTYPTTKEIVLNQNYRSTQNILNLAEQILTHNPAQKKKNLFTDNPDNVDVTYYHARNDKDEGEFIIRSLRKLYIDTDEKKIEVNNKKHDTNILDEIEFEPDDKPNDSISNMFDMYLSKSNDFSFGRVDNVYAPTSWNIPKTNWKNVPKLNECVVLYRTHSQSRSIEESFIKHGLPYKVISGVKFLDRKEIKDVLSILKFLANGEDKISLSRFLPMITDGVGPKAMEKILAYLEDFDYPLVPKLSDVVTNLLTKMQSVWLDNTSLIEMTKSLLVNLGYFAYLKDSYPIKEEYDTKVENINELYSLMMEYDEDKSLDLHSKLMNFLNYVSLMSSQDNREGEDVPKISLMSLHQSKGLEYETVFLVGIEDGLLPHHNSLYEVGGFDEEVRLAYVGVTRAKKHLYLTSADSRVQFGQIQANPVSRIFRPFLDTYCKNER